MLGGCWPVALGQKGVLGNAPVRMALSKRNPLHPWYLAKRWEFFWPWARLWMVAEGPDGAKAGYGLFPDQAGDKALA